MAFIAFRRLVRAAGLLVLAGVIGAAAASADPVTLRIGVQKYGTLIIARERKALERKFAGTEVTVQWNEFPAGPQMLEALGAGSLDLGTVGEAPPVFSQAAGAPMLYVGNEPAVPSGEAILVAKDSPIQTLADLRGKRVALNKGSNVHFLLIQALAKGGVELKDITPVYLTPADGRAAFESGAVDAWVIWDPFLAAAEAATSSRVLVDGKGLAPNRQFYISTRKFAAEHADLLRAVLGVIKETDVWSSAHPDETVTLLSARTGIPADALKPAVLRLGYGVTPLDAGTVADQQRIADAFFSLHLIPAKLTVADAVWAGPY
jgi:sulfonate transport system substrate-binding protein